MLPTTLNSDVTKFSIMGPVHGIAATMQKFLELGVFLKQTIAMTTINPARAIHIDDCKGKFKGGHGHRYVHSDDQRG